MKFPIFHQYFSINILICIAILELLSFIPILLCIAFPNLFLFFLSLLFIIVLYITHYCIVPFCILLLSIEYYLRKTRRIVKANIVNIPVKFQKYIYIITALIYITITIIGIIVGQPITEEELRYD